MPEKGAEGSEFRVVDKRRFDETGKTREGKDVPVENVTAAWSEPAKVEAPRPAPAAQSRPAAPARQPSSEPDEVSGQGAVDFSSLIMSLATQALIMMGEIPSEGTRGSRNLEGAQQTIDIIAMLVEKTKGNLSAEEDRLVAEVLAQLRMAFVNSVGK